MSARCAESVHRMIKSKQDYREYVAADNAANHVPGYCRCSMLCRILGLYNVQYLRCLRRLEYVQNCKTGIVRKIESKLLGRRLRKLSVMTGITIPPHTFGKGLYIPHWGSIVVNGSARFGDHCVIQSGVNVSEGVTGGRHIYLSAGAKVLIGVHIADDVIVGANAVLTHDVPEPNVVVAGIPARKISDRGFRDRDKV